MPFFSRQQTLSQGASGFGPQQHTPECPQMGWGLSSPSGHSDQRNLSPGCVYGGGGCKWEPGDSCFTTLSKSPSPLSLSFLIYKMGLQYLLCRLLVRIKNESLCEKSFVSSMSPQSGLILLKTLGVIFPEQFSHQAFPAADRPPSPQQLSS